MAVLPNGYLVSGGAGNTIKIWNTDTGNLVRTLSGHTDQVYAFTVLPNGYLVSGSGDMSIKIWDTSSGSLINTLRKHTSWLHSFVVLNNGYLVSCGGDSTIKIWNLNSTNNFTLINTPIISTTRTTTAPTTSTSNILGNFIYLKNSSNI
jgi:WD40 repeat protein